VEENREESDIDMKTETETRADSKIDTGTHKQRQASQLFLVRLWTDEGEGQDNRESDSSEQISRHLHGKAQHVITGEAHNFSDWAGLVDILLAMMPREPDASDR